MLMRMTMQTMSIDNEARSENGGDDDDANIE